MRVLKGLGLGIILALGAFAVFLGVSARISGGPPTLAGHQLLTVLSGSMEPAFRPGDLILVKPVPAAELAVGDVITFHDPELPELLITHRIVSIMTTQQGARLFQTKGDANAAVDESHVHEMYVVGQQVGRLPFVGHFTSFVRTPLGALIFVVLPGLALIGLELRGLWLHLLKEAEAEEGSAAGGDGQELQEG